MTTTTTTNSITNTIGDVQEIYDSLMNPTSCSELDVNAIVEGLLLIIINITCPNYYNVCLHIQTYTKSIYLGYK